MIDIIIGIILGIISSILPGVHINTVAQIFSEAVSSEAMLIGIGIFSVLGVLPSVFLGVPDSSTIGSYFPIQKMMQNGELKKGIILIVLSALFSSLLAVTIINIYPTLVTGSYAMVKGTIPYVLGLFIVYSLIFNGWWDRVIIILSGILGMVLFNLPISNVLLPTFAGMYAVPFLLSSFSQGQSYPKQYDKPVKFPYFFMLLGTILGFVAALLPAISSPAQLAILVTPFLNSSSSFLVLSTSILVSKYIFAVPMAVELGKPRIGAYSFITFPDYGWLFVLFGVSIGATVIYFVSDKLSKLRLDQQTVKYITIILIFYLMLLTFLLQNWIGLVVFLASSCLGMFAQSVNTKKTNLMNVIIIPTFLRFII
ncbi:tripartite tricarboxylate transporter permease [Candidatus Micrarchaeota archaeon]|nr:tripartite tricarboxylate transporter permease [Candidatus Micrarchaeota archaeon]